MNLNMNTNGVAQQVGVTEGGFIVAVTAPEVLMPIYLVSILSTGLIQVVQSVVSDSGSVVKTQEPIIGNKDYEPAVKGPDVQVSQSREQGLQRDNYRNDPKP